MNILNAGPSVGDLVRISHGSEMEYLDYRWGSECIEMLRELLVYEKAKNAHLTESLNMAKQVIDLLKMEIEYGKPQKPSKMHEM